MSIVLKLKVERPERILRGQKHYWAVMRAQQAEHGHFTVAAIDKASNTNPGDIRSFVARLVSAGIVEHIGTKPHALGGSATKIYRIVRDQNECPRVGKDGATISSAQRNIWNVLRGPMGRNGINARDLAAFAATEDAPVSLGTARQYLKILALAGYLTALTKGKPGTLAVWRLKPAMNTGPLPPMILRSKMVYDQNANKMMGDVIAEEDRP